MAFIFYDTETTGIHTRFDQILQFAAIRTDAEFNEIDRFELRSRINPDVLASPGAMKVTGVTAQQLTNQNTPSYFEMCKAIHSKIQSWSPSTIVGYNSISFDEELLRSAFYQSLLPIYLTNTSGNSRFDILTVARAAHAFIPEILVWPINEKGKVSFKLDQLAPANGFNHANAHEAMSDVEATIYIAKLIKVRAPQLWEYLFNVRTKAAATSYAMHNSVVTSTSFLFGKQNSNLITALGVNPDNTGQLFAFNLAVDPEVALHRADAELLDFFKSKPRPIVTIKVNASPTLLPVELAGSACGGFELGDSEIQRRAELLSNNPNFVERLIEICLQTKEPYPESEHVEEQIFGGFYKTADQERIDAFHLADWKVKFSIASQFEDKRLQTLALRLVYREASEVIPSDTKRTYDEAVAKRLLCLDDAIGVPWTTIAKAIAEAQEILENDPGNSLIQGHMDYLMSEQNRLIKILERQNNSA